jgi:aminopeptidase N
MRHPVHALAATLCALAAATTTAAAAPTPGAPGLGDPFFPQGGNGGYDVAGYALALAYDPGANRLSGTATITATATQDLSRFDLDLRGFDVGAVTVAGAPAAVARDGQELIVTPAKALRRGQAFTVVVPYAGVPEVVTDPDGSIEGWVPTKDGAFVVGEPQGAPAWFPANDNPRDKATFQVSMTVPAGLTAVGNGELVSQTTSGGRTTFTWRERFPMATYLATITTGRFDVTQGRTPGGVPTYVAVDPALASSAAGALRALPEAIDFYTSIYGPYPFEDAGAIVDDAPSVGYSLETQTKPVFAYAPDEATVVHELAHQWFGDAVTLTTWPDIWLHEGFATWSEWIWDEHLGRRSAAQELKTLYSTRASDTAFWGPAIAALPGPADLFDGTVYVRGAMTLEALREKVGDAAFFRLLRTWFAEHRYGNVTTADFIATAERVTGQDLTAFFDAWIFSADKPVSW